MANSVTTTGAATVIPGGTAATTWEANGYFSVVDVFVDRDTTVTLPAGVDGQKVGVRFWGAGSTSHVVTWGSGLNVATIAGTSFGTISVGKCDYLEVMWSDQDTAWWGLSFVPGIDQ